MGKVNLTDNLHERERDLENVGKILESTNNLMTKITMLLSERKSKQFLRFFETSSSTLSSC